jgi:hypothetical protein
MPPITKKEKAVRITLVIANLIVATLIIISIAGILKDTNKNPIKTFFQKVFSGGAEKPEGDAEDGTPNNGNSAGGSSSGAGGEPSGGSGGSGEGGQEEPQTPGCIFAQISYSLENFKENSLCNEYDGIICVRKTISCSIEIHNGDQNYSGNFKIKVSFNDLESNNAIDSYTQDFMININEFEIFGAEKIVESTGENGQANKEIRCVYTTLEVPQKEVCL